MTDYGSENEVNDTEETEQSYDGDDMSVDHMTMMINVTQLRVMSWKKFQSECILYL